MAAGNPLQNLLEEATCSICLGPFKDPVITPCVHHYCRSCITGCSQEPGAPLCCPQCREPCSLADLRPNRELQSMVELLSQLSAQPQRPPLEEGVCVQHEEKLKLFSQDDKKLICVICQVSREHEKHKVRPISEAAQDYQGKLQYWLPPLQRERDAIVMSKQKEEEEYNDMRGNLQAERMKTTAEFDRLRQMLKEQEQAILERLEEMEKKVAMVENANLAKLSNQISSLQTLIKEIETKCEQSPGELLKDAGLTLSRCENVKFREPQLQIEENKKQSVQNKSIVQTVNSSRNRPPILTLVELLRNKEQSIQNKSIVQTVNSSRNRPPILTLEELLRNKGIAERGSQYMDNSLWTASHRQNLAPEEQKAVQTSQLKALGTRVRKGI